MASGFRYFTDMFHAMPRPLRGMLLMLVSAIMVVVMNVTVRQIASELHVFEIAALRNFFGFLLFLPWLIGARTNPLRTRRIVLHMGRAGFNTVATIAYFVALILIPLTQVTALTFTAPLIATLLAVLVLHESMSARRWAGFFVGLAGALIILRPGVRDVGTGQLMVLLSSATWASALICTKVLARTETSLTIAAYSALLQVPIAMIGAVFVWQMPSLRQVGILFLIGGMAGFIQLCIAQAFRDADATLVLPFDFTKLIWASIAGYLVFSEIPDYWTWIGAVVVFLGVFYMALQERREN
jgi:drug/metabolite transporter (DMT)-like permease